MMKNERNEFENSDIKAVARGNLNTILQAARNYNNAQDQLSSFHVQDLTQRIDMILDPR